MSRSDTAQALTVTGLRKSYRGVVAVDSLDLQVAPGEIVGLIGPNGSGKTTALDCISGVQRPDRGTVSFAGSVLRRRTPTRLARLGMIRTFQAVRIFPTLTVRENLAVLTAGRDGQGIGFLRGLGSARRWGDTWRRVESVVERLELGHVADRPAGELSYGQRKLVELGGALVEDPGLLLLDEPVAAVNPTLANTIRDHIVALNQEGTSVLLVEHNIELVTDICARVVVLDAGKVIASGDPASVMADSRVQEAYFGN